MIVSGVVKRGRKVFLCLHPSVANQYLTKDPGMFAYIMGRDFNYDGYVACYRNGEYPDLETETKGLNLVFMEKGFLHPVFGSLPDRLFFILRNAKKIDVLQVFQFSWPSLLSGMLYKLLNPKGVVYIKLDLDFEHIHEYGNAIRDFVLCSSLAHYDIISVESEKALEYLKSHPSLKRLSSDFHCIPNGVDVAALSRFSGAWKDKENIVLYNGRLGSPQKATDVALEAFDRASRGFPTWKLVLIGPAEKGFEGMLAKYRKNPQIKYLGFVSKEELYGYFRKSKIFLFPSRFESFGFSQFEAGFFGCAVLGSDIVAMRQATGDGRFGGLCPVDGVNCFEEKLRGMMSSEKSLMEKSEGMRRHIIENYDWHGVCAGLESIIGSLRMK
jgi:glycosyltransferase involved in cell wall biosynthesis